MSLTRVYEEARQRLEWIRAGNGPYFLEIETYRFRGHSMGDPERYRKQDEVHEWQTNDPIGIFRQELLDQQIVGEEELNQMDTRARQDADEAVQFAENSPEPAAEALFEHIYVEG